MFNRNGNQNPQYQQPQTEDRAPDQVLCEIDRSFGDKKEVLRVSIGEYKGKKFASVRVFWFTPEETWAPGKSGVAIRKKELAQVIEALQEIQQQLGGW